MATTVTIKQGDITALDVDAIVNSANNDLVLGGGVSGALRRLGGPTIQEECNAIGTIPLGEAVVTTGGNLRAKWVIHAATNPLGLWADAKSVRTAARSVLKRAVEKGIRTLAFPAIGTGAGGFSVDRCADVLLEEMEAHLKGPTTLENVTFVLYDEKAYKQFEDRFMRKMPDAWTAMTGLPVPPLPPEPEPEPEPPPPPPPPPRRDRPRPGQPGQPPGGQRPRPGQPPPSPQGGRPEHRRRRRGGRNRHRGPRPDGPRPPQGGANPPRPTPPPAPPAAPAP